MSDHTLSAEPTHSVWDRSLAPRLRIEPGDEVAFECTDSSGGQVRPGTTSAEFLAIDRTRIHALTGPVWIEGAEAGDVLEVEVLSTRHADWGWSSVLHSIANDGIAHTRTDSRSAWIQAAACAGTGR